jgi:hypothetical protein
LQAWRAFSKGLPEMLSCQRISGVSWILLAHEVFNMHPVEAKHTEIALNTLREKKSEAQSERVVCWDCSASLFGQCDYHRSQSSGEAKP